MKIPTFGISLPSFRHSLSQHSTAQRFGCQFRLTSISKIWFVLLSAMILSPTGFAVADITLPKFFSDHMVLQQESLFPVWGTAEPNQALVIRFNGTETKSVAGGDGKFSVSIQTPTAGGPYSIEVEDQNQSNKVVLTDVMVGDVWLCAGQTNMGMPVSEALNAETEIALSKKHTSIRLFSLEPTPAQQPSEDHWGENDDPEAPNRPGSFFNGMISPLSAYPVKGVIWYQGETNVGRGKQYGHLMKCLIEDWRRHFASPELPFYFVQITPFRYSNFSSEALPELWDAQLSTLKTVQGTAMVPTMDVGSADEMFPKNKQVIGQRLAKLALAKTYHTPLPDPSAEKLPPVTGPIYEAVAYREGKIRVTFREVGSGLKLIGDPPPGSFTVCGPDQVFHPAEATIIGPASVELSSDQVTAPKAVRYCWDDSAKPSLANSADLPAFPFRTDSQELKSEETAF